MAVDALAQNWTGKKPYLFPPFILLGRVLQKLVRDQVEEAVLVAPMWPSQTWYPLLLQLLTEVPRLLPQQQLVIQDPLGQPHPLVERLHLTAWKVSPAFCGFSEEAFNLIASAWRKGTEKSYASSWRRWCGWCDRRGYNPISPTLPMIAQFLTKEFQLGKQYSTLNSYRSALSATIPPIEGHAVGKHPTIVCLLQGAFNERPPAPRYQNVWSVRQVIAFIKGMPKSTLLDLGGLSKKLTMLLALSNGKRSSDIHALNIRFRRFTDEGVIFRIPGLTKTRRSGPP